MEQNQSAPLSRVYMDIPATVHHAAKLEALKQGKTLKAWLEELVNAAVSEKGKKGKK